MLEVAGLPQLPHIPQTPQGDCLCNDLGLTPHFPGLRASTCPTCIRIAIPFVYIARKNQQSFHRNHIILSQVHRQYEAQYSVSTADFALLLKLNACLPCRSRG